MAITFVKKIKSDGSPCRKCAEVEGRLASGGLLDRIERVVIADERDPQSEGMLLAAELGVDAAPFFVVTEGGARRVFTSYVKLLKEVLSVKPSDTEEAMEILARNKDIDLL